MKLTRSIILGSAAAAVGSTVVYAASHSDLPLAVQARLHHMELFEFTLGSLVPMARGQVDFDAEAAQRAADNLNLIAQIDTTAYWPEGTSTEDLEGTRALPEIWADIPSVLAEVEKLQTATAALAESAGTLDGVRATLGPVGGACTSCHEKYRKPE